MPATVILVHGAWSGAWCWDQVVPRLADADVPTVAVDLPGHGHSDAPLGDLHAHIAYVRDVLAGIDGPVVLAGHSYGGAVISEAAFDQENVRHLVYICALMPDAGEAVTTVMADTVRPEDGASDLGPALVTHDDGTITLRPDAAVPALFADCAPADVDFALTLLGPQNASSLGQPLHSAAWHYIPSTYVVCTEDRAVNPTLQRAMATRATNVVEWPTSHSPFLSRPGLVSQLLARLAIEYAPMHDE